MRNMENAPGDNTGRLQTFYEAPSAIAYAATIDLGVLKGVSVGTYSVNVVGGNATINLSTIGKANLVKGDIVNLIVIGDGTARTITWGTNIKPRAATFATLVNGKLFIQGYFDGTDLILNV